MSAQPEMPSPLAPYRVLELTGEAALLYGKIFADLGADVIKVERPGGDPARNIGPFYHDIPDPEKSLYWLAFSTGKRSITLDIETADGKALFKRLIKTADFVVESFPPGCMEKLGLGYAALSEINPGIIMASITPFGQSGPYAHFKGPDIVPWAMSGYMYLCGQAERAPVRISLRPQAYLHAAAMAAVGSLIALHHRAVTGEGQHVDQSMQQCPSWFLTHTYQMWELMQIILARQGVWRQFGRSQMRTVYPCKDGYVVLMVMGGVIGARAQQRMAQWMDSEGMAPDWMKGFDWEQFDAFTTTQEQADLMAEAFGDFFRTKTKAELLEEAVKEGYMLAPVSTAEDIVKDPQLQARDYWVQVEHPKLGAAITYPGAPCKLSETPWRIRGPAPRIGEHNGEIYRELGLSCAELLALKGAKVI